LRIIQGSSDLSKHWWLKSESLCAEPIIADGPMNHFFSFQRWASLEVLSSPLNSVFFVLCILTYRAKKNIVSGQKAHTSRVKLGEKASCCLHDEMSYYGLQIYTFSAPEFS